MVFQFTKRFYEKWLQHYQKVKRPIPIIPYCFPTAITSIVRSVEMSLRGAFKRPPFSATGVAIPARVLRQTCGHIYSRKQDASMLARMGWSPQFAFHYTWLPKIFYKKIESQNQVKLEKLKFNLSSLYKNESLIEKWKFLLQNRSFS